MIDVKPDRPMRDIMNQKKPSVMARAPAHPDEARVIQPSMFEINIQSIAYARFGQQIFRLR